MNSEFNHSRRGFLRGRVRSGASPVRPPWALPEATFLAACTRCRNCAIICPTRIIQIGDGYPHVDFSIGTCTFCGECVRVCAPAALRRTENAAPWQRKARVKEGCLANRGVECRICGEQCEAEAIRFLPRAGGLPAPEVLPDRCTGCGACVAPCPARVIEVA